MGKIAIITDSTAYIPVEYAKKHQVHVIPLNLHWDEDTFKDGVDITADAFYTRPSYSSSIPTTSQPSAGDFLDLFTRLGKTHDGIIAALISSGISGTMDSALLAQKEYNGVPVEVLDTKVTAGSLALVVEALVKCVADGKSMEDCKKTVADIVDTMGTYFVVDTLKYLHKGGRIGGASRFFGAALEIKPILYLNQEGKIDALEKVRTKKKAYLRLKELVAEKAGGKKCHVAIMHAQALEDANTIKAELSEQMDCASIGIYDLSPVIGTHAGEGTLGIAVHTVMY
jgi:DegV family protein with EDD domain